MGHRRRERCGTIWLLRAAERPQHSASIDWTEDATLPMEDVRGPQGALICFSDAGPFFSLSPQLRGHQRTMWCENDSNK